MLVGPSTPEFIQNTGKLSENVVDIDLAGRGGKV